MIRFQIELAKDEPLEHDSWGNKLGRVRLCKAWVPRGGNRLCKVWAWPTKFYEGLRPVIC